MNSSSYSNMDLHHHHSEAMQTFGTWDIWWEGIQPIKYGYCKQLYLACASHLLISLDIVLNEVCNNYFPFSLHAFKFSIVSFSLGSEQLSIYITYYI